MARTDQQVNEKRNEVDCSNDGTTQQISTARITSHRPVVLERRKERIVHEEKGDLRRIIMHVPKAGPKGFTNATPQLHRICKAQVIRYIPYTEGPITTMSPRINRVERTAIKQPTNQRYCIHMYFPSGRIRHSESHPRRNEPLLIPQLYASGLRESCEISRVFTNHTQPDAKRSKQSPAITIENSAERTTPDGTNPIDRRHRKIVVLKTGMNHTLGIMNTPNHQLT
jgi:hypothetical protein